MLSIVIGSVCWVEASGNEMFSMCAENPSNTDLAGLLRDRVALAGLLWTERHAMRDSNCVKKWTLLTKALLGNGLVGKKPASTSTAVSEMNLLVELRNRRIHAKPSHWPTQDKDDHDLEQRLRGKFRLNTFDGKTVFFPNEVLSAGCATWAIDTAGNFLRYAFGLLGVAAKFGA